MREREGERFEASLLRRTVLYDAGRVDHHALAVPHHGSLPLWVDLLFKPLLLFLVQHVDPSPVEETR